MLSICQNWPDRSVRQLSVPISRTDSLNSSKFDILRVVCNILKQFRKVAYKLLFKLVHSVCKLIELAGLSDKIMESAQDYCPNFTRIFFAGERCLGLVTPWTSFRVFESAEAEAWLSTYKMQVCSGQC